MKPGRNGAAVAILAVWVAAVAFLTLSPGGSRGAPTLGGFLCVMCGTRDLADVVLNVLLFVPGGVALGALLGSRGAVAAAALLTVTIELVQIAVPGRDPTVQDLVANTAGAALGAWLVRKTDGGQRAAAAVALAVVGAWLAPAALLAPAPGDPAALYGQLGAGGGFAAYPAEVVSADIGGHPLRRSRLPGGEAVRGALAAAEPVRVRFVQGPPRPALGQIAGVYDEGGAQHLFLGGIRDDLVVRRHTLAVELELDQPDARWHGAFAGAQPGDTLDLVVEPGRSSLCATVGSRSACRIAPGAGDGWGLLLYLEAPGRGLRAALSLLWSLGLGALLGGAAPRGRMLAAVLAAVGFTAGVVLPWIRPAPLQAAALVAGAWLGTALGPRARSALELLRPPARPGGGTPRSAR